MDTLSRLVDALRCLPGIGPKSAQRMVYYLLQHQRARGLNLAACLEEAMRVVQHCARCNNFTDAPICALCQDSKRDRTLLCVVETPADVIAIEQSHAFHGLYYVLMNRISPLDGVGPEDIGLSKLQQFIEQEPVKEIVLALSPTIEGQTTMHFIQALLKNYSLMTSQLAQGIPSGGELEFLDSNTIGNALKHRANISMS